MNRLALHIADLIEARLGQAPSGEVRLIFHGPPMEILETVFEELSDRAGSDPAVPVLLKLPELTDGNTNPPLGASGRCDDAHLLNLRNSPLEPAFLALVPPGQHSMLSVTSTTDEFGVSGQKNGPNVPFEDWWSDQFIQAVVGSAIEAVGIIDPDVQSEARELVALSTRACDELQESKADRAGCWRVISRLFSGAESQADLSPAARVSLACGVPPLRSAGLSRREQAGILEKIADAMADGFAAGIRRAQENANQEEAVELDCFLEHLRSQGALPTAFERSTAAHYAPSTGLEVCAPPSWWSALPAERWAELLTEDSTSEGDILMGCSNPLVRLGKGMPVLVQDAVELTFEAVGEAATGTLLTVSRGTKDVRGEVKVGTGTVSFTDADLPSHRSPIRYSATADKFKPGALKVVSLASWEPGIFVVARTAKKLAPPKKPSRKGRDAPDFETSLTVPGGGRYELMVFTSGGVSLPAVASGSADSAQSGQDNARELAIRKVRDGLHQIEVEADSNYQVDLHFTRSRTDGTTSTELCRISLVVEEVAEQGCRSEFERLIRSNRRRIDRDDAKAVVQLTRSSRSSSLQDWVLSEQCVARSFIPVVLADDYEGSWVQPSWDGPEAPKFSSGRFLHDPRPSSGEFQPPSAFVEARKAIARRIRGEGDETGLVEAAELGRWLLDDPQFRSEIEQYLDSYQQWLAADPDVACWADVVTINTLEPDGRTLSRAPDAVLLSPLHPVRLAWQALAQQILLEAEREDQPCPAASVLDPDCIPDLLPLSLRSPAGIEKVDFLSVENGTDYWSVLWNGDRLNRLPERSRQAPFGPEFGITVGGISVGFSSAQVARALDDVCGLLSAKPTIGVVVASSGGSTDSCNDGLITWSADRYQASDASRRQIAPGPRFLDVFDTRDEGARPDDATIANLSEDTNNGVRWFMGQPRSARPDLGIVAQLDMSEPKASQVEGRSVLGRGAMLRHRIRRQLPGAFLCETRQPSPAASSGDPLPDKLAACVAALESLGDRRTGMQFAPNVNAINDLFENSRADFVATSSSAIDPACFLGGWLQRAYLWDYDMPSYSHRAGDTNGYYLLSRINQANEEALSTALARLPGCGALPTEEAAAVLLEVARRGIPTVRGLSGDDTGATGDLGMFVAVRVLQDSFRLENTYQSLLPVFEEVDGGTNVTILVPVDPFRGYLSDLARSLGHEKADRSLSRPDLLVVGIRLEGESAAIHLTPIEVKCRPGSVFPQGEVGAALEQARCFSKLLEDMLPREGQVVAWDLAFQHLLLSVIGFGLRVYSQHQDVTGRADKWASLHEKVAQAIVAPMPRVTIDKVGRLIIVDDSARSGVRDTDNDGLPEVLTIGSTDAGLVVNGDPREFYGSVRAKLDRWDLYPTSSAAVEVATQEQEVTDVATVGHSSNCETDEPTNEATSPPLTESLPVSQVEPVQVAQPAPIAQGVILEVGDTIDSFKKERIRLNISDTRLNQLNMGVVGDLGTGKTQLLKSLITQITNSTEANRGIRPRFLIFDYKRDYSSEDFVAATGARVVKPHRLPLNLFDTRALGDSSAPWLDRFRFFADVLDKIYSGIGPVQRDKLKRAVRSAYDSRLGGEQPTLYDVHAAYSELLDGRADSPMAIIDDLVDMEVFASRTSDTIPFDEFLDGVVVISLDALGQDDRSKNMLVAVMLNMFYENMLRTPKRPFLGSDPQLRAVDSYLLVDEADNIMRYEFDVLRKLLLQGREFGTGVILASQYLRHFKVNATDYREPLLSWFVHKVPNVTPAELSALGLASGTADMAERIKSLGVHQCLYKSFDVPGEVVRGVPFFELQTAPAAAAE